MVVDLKASRTEHVQLAFDLRVENPFALKYFVEHSGVTDAVAALKRSIEHYLSAPGELSFVTLWGPSGLGKSHLIRGFAEEARNLGISEQQIRVHDLGDVCLTDETWVSEFVSDFNYLKSSGGLFLSATETHAQDLELTPHVKSRLLASELVKVGYPHEQELRPILLSLMERRNLRLSERQIEYLLKRIPRDPLSFDSIFAKISDISWAESRPANQRVIKQVVELELSKVRYD